MPSVDTRIAEVFLPASETTGLPNLSSELYLQNLSTLSGREMDGFRGLSRLAEIPPVLEVCFQSPEAARSRWWMQKERLRRRTEPVCTATNA